MDNSQQNNKYPKSYWPHGIIVFFLVVFGFNFWFAYQAILSNKGNVEEDVYQNSLKYQEVIDLKTASQKLGWRAKCQYQSGKLNVKIVDASQQAVDNLQVTLDLIILSETGKGFKLKLQPTVKPGNYQAGVSLTTGLWQIKLYAEGQDKKFYNEQQLLVS